MLRIVRRAERAAFTGKRIESLSDWRQRRNVKRLDFLHADEVSRSLLVLALQLDFLLLQNRNAPLDEIPSEFGSFFGWFCGFHF